MNKTALADNPQQEATYHVNATASSKWEKQAK